MTRSDLFGPRPRREPRVMMKPTDAGVDEAGNQIIEYRCRRCGHDAGWVEDPRSTSAIKRGRPCPVCNAPQEQQP